MISPLALIPEAEEEQEPAPDVTGMLETARALCYRLQGETHLAVRRALILALIVNPTQNAVRAMLRRAGDEDVHLRAQVLTILRLMPEALEALMENFLADEDRMVRQFALNIVDVKLPAPCLSLSPASECHQSQTDEPAGKQGRAADPGARPSP